MAEAVDLFTRFGVFQCGVPLMKQSAFIAGCKFPLLVVIHKIFYQLFSEIRFFPPSCTTLHLIQIEVKFKRIYSVYIKII